MLQAATVREGAAEGLESYEARMTERMRVGLGIGGRTLKRERTLYHRERAAQVYWSARGDNRLRWLGSRTEQPALGRVGGLFGLDIDVESDLALDDIRVPLRYDPRADRVDLFDAGFVQPVSSLGLALYRFQSGDTLRISLPEPGQSLALIEVRVTPRVEAWETVTGSLWFDASNGVLVRAAFRPSGVWDHELQEPGDLDDVPGVFKPAIGRIDHIVIEYALYEQRWWLPRRMVADGLYEWGRLVRMPLQVEWTVSDYEIDGAPTALVTPSDSVVPSRRRLDPGLPGTDGRWQVLSPSDRSALVDSPDLPPPLTVDGATAFTREDLGPLLDQLQDVAGAPPQTTRSLWRGDLLRSLRYDRVRGLSAGAQYTPLEGGSLALDADVRVGTLGFEPTGRLELRPSRVRTLGRSAAPEQWRFAVYSHIGLANEDWGPVFTLGNSVATLVAGHDDGEYFRASGVEGVLSGFRGPATWSVSLFAEEHHEVRRHTSVSLATIGGGELRSNLSAETGSVLGARAALGLGGRPHPDGHALALRWDGEWTGGDLPYARSQLQATAAAPLGHVQVGLNLGAGMASTNVPTQRAFHIGGTSSVRGHVGSSQAGTAYWLARAEMGTSVAMARGILFGDLGWAGPRGDLRSGRPLSGVGLGASLVDGLLRLDLARGRRGSGGWRLHFYLDGLI